jgi:signal transduction histidine kinase
VGAIAGAVEALELGAREDPEARDRFISLIGRQAVRLTRLTNSLLILARAQTREEGVQLVEVELDRLLREIAESDETGRVRVECKPGTAALTQPDVLEQVVANLVGNALKHATTGSIVLRCAQNGRETTIDVTDSGPGIAPERRERSFDRFYTGGQRTRDGFGLGLAIARDATAALGGRLELDSELGVGTTARVILPAP